MIRAEPTSIPPALLPPTPDPATPAPTRAGAVAAVGARGVPDPAALAGLPACVADARVAALRREDGPPDPTAFAPLRARVARATAQLPPVYRRTVGEPLLRALEALGARGFARVLAGDPDREGEARLVLDAAQAVLQHGERYAPGATAAFQEVVSDLYDGFLSAEARRGVKPPEGGTTPPIVRWGSAADGPYTWPVDATATLGLGAALVSLPAANAEGGLLAWAALAHETAGHDVVAADRGLEEELGRAVRAQLLAGGTGLAVADYWADRVGESAADVLGVLNMGPASAVALVGYLRAMNGAFGGSGTLRNVGGAGDPHPADLARAYLVAETVRLLSFEGADRWADRLVAEADRDLGRIRLGDVAVTAGVAKASAAAVARALATTRLAALEGRALRDVQDWSDRDEAVAAELRGRVREGAPGAGAFADGAYAAHAVAAGVYEAVSGAEPPGRAFDGMVAVLAAMHARNPAWAAPAAAA